MPLSALQEAALRIVCVVCRQRSTWGWECGLVTAHSGVELSGLEHSGEEHSGCGGAHSGLKHSWSERSGEAHSGEAHSGGAHHVMAPSGIAYHVEGTHSGETHSAANSEGANSGLRLLVVVQLPICRHHCSSSCKPRTNATLTTAAAAAVADGDTAPNVPPPPLAFNHLFSADAIPAALLQAQDEHHF